MMQKQESKIRTTNFLSQVKSSLIYKILSILISFILVPIMIRYLGNEKYGVWATLLTIINLVIFFDFGIANGTRNYISKALFELKNNNEVKSFISTGYGSLIIFSIILYILFYIISFWINWQLIFNITDISNKDLQRTVNITLFFILLNFSLSMSHQVYNAIQKSSLIVINQFLINIIMLFLILIINQFSNHSIVFLALSYGLSIVSANIIVSYAFYKNHSHLIPSIYFFQIKKVKKILSVGIKFFVLQLSLLLIISSDKIIITQLLNPSYVATYDVMYKYFSILLIIHAIINNPLWSTYAEAYIKEDYNWIKNTLLKMNILFIVLIIISILMVVFGKFIICIWIGEQSKLILKDKSNLIYMAIMILIMIWHNTYAYFVNGINKINYQMYSLLFGVIINIPLSIYFVKYLSMGINGVILSTILSLSIFSIIGPIQVYFELRKIQK